MSNKLKKSEPYIMLGTPCIDQAPIEFTQALSALNWPCKWTSQFIKSSSLATSRDYIVKEAIEKGCTHIMWIDSDESFPADSVKKLLDHNVDICAGIVYSKDYNNCTPCAWENLVFDEAGNLVNGETIKQIPQYGEVELIGTGFVLVKIEVFKDVIARYGKIFAHDFNTSEDFSFFIRAKRCGYKIMVDGSIPIQHWGAYPFSHKDYYRCAAQRKKLAGD